MKFFFKSFIVFCLLVFFSASVFAGSFISVIDTNSFFFRSSLAAGLSVQYHAENDGLVVSFDGRPLLFSHIPRLSPVDLMHRVHNDHEYVPGSFVCKEFAWDLINRLQKIDVNAEYWGVCRNNFRKCHAIVRVIDANVFLDPTENRSCVGMGCWRDWNFSEVRCVGNGCYSFDAVGVRDFGVTAVNINGFLPSFLGSVVRVFSRLVFRGFF